MSSRHRLTQLLQTTTSPVAITFCDAPPDGVPRIEAPGPASCAYWRRAAEGEVFYTEAADHHGCPVGAHTHRVDLPLAVQKELEGTIATMLELQYLKETDIPQIPQRQAPFKYAVYAPLSQAPVDPDVVLIRGNVQQLMLLAESAQSAGIAGATPTMGRPTCAVLPQALNSDAATSSFGCVGNRVYTGAGDDEGYFAVPGQQLDALVEALAVMVDANAALEKFHRARATT